MRIIFTILAGLALVAAIAALREKTPSKSRAPAAASTAPAAAIAVPASGAPGTAARPAGQGSETAVHPQARQASLLMRRALASLESHAAIAARLRYQARVLGQEMLGSGQYLQGPTAEHRYRLDLKLQVAGQTASLVHVCDGQTLWIHQQLLGDPSIMRVDVPSTLFALATRRQAAGFPSFPRTPGIGGLPRMLREVEEAFDFRCLGKTKLGKLSVLVLSGRWDEAYLTSRLPGAATWFAEEEGENAPAQLPTHVLVCLGEGDYFPYRTEYRRDLARAAEFAEELDDAEHLMLRLELFEVRINGPVDANRFSYSPGDLPVADYTDAYQQQLGVVPVE